MRDEKEAAWVGLVAPPGEGYWSLLPLGLDLYDGHPGVLLFLAYLGALTGEGRYTSLAESALASLRRMIDRGRSTFKTIGYTNGWGGIIYTLRPSFRALGATRPAGGGGRARRAAPGR